LHHKALVDSMNRENSPLTETRQITSRISQLWQQQAIQ
jgi:hypothetical protein